MIDCSIENIRADLQAVFEQDNTFEVVNINVTRLDGKLHFLMEIVGPEIYPDDKVKELESQVAQNYSEQIKLYAWSRIEVINGSEGPLSKIEFLKSFSDRQNESLPAELPLMLEASSR